MMSLVLRAVLVMMFAGAGGTSCFSTGGKVLIFSVMDNNFAEIYRHRIAANAAYSQLHNYSFVHDMNVFGLTREELAMPPTTYKVSAALRLLKGRSTIKAPLRSGLYSLMLTRLCKMMT